MKHIRSRFVFYSQERSGILLLVGALCFGVSGYHYVDVEEDDILDISSPEIVALQTQIDSLKAIEIENRKPKLYPFNPNFITDYKAYTLGMTPEEFDRLKTFRKKGQWINSVADFKRVTGVSDSLLNAISPLFKFPDWVTNPKPKRAKIAKYASEVISEKQDLNQATTEDLQRVYGIGEKLGARIVAYRKKLGGFVHETQLHDVYGLDEAVVERTLKRFEVKGEIPVQTMDVNSVSASDLATIPGVSFELAKKIWEFRVLRERIDSLPELRKIEGLSERKFRLIKLYLSTE